MSETGRDLARLRCDYVHPMDRDEILINILSKLPVKEVATCKCVAKSWLRLISEPGFPLLHLTLSRKRLKYIICPYPQDHDLVTHLAVMEENGIISQDIPLPCLDGICTPEVTCFSNGLICSINEDCYESFEVDIRICNPITHETLLLPRGSRSEVVPSVGIAFDPKTGNFKAFRFFSDSPQGDVVKYKCEAYTAGSTTWRTIADDVQRPDQTTSHPNCPYYASVAGAVYWFEWSDCKPGTPVCIHSADVNDKFAKIDLPAKLHKWSFLIELEGCLSVVHVNTPELSVLGQHEDAQTFVEVYKLENGAWTLRSKAAIDLINVHSFNSVVARDSEIFFIIRLKDETFYYLIFDFVEKMFTTLDLDENFENCSLVAFSFTESLLKCSSGN